MKRKVIFITCLSLCLSSFQIISNQPAIAAVCQGPAAYPPDLPDCLDPVVEEQRVAAAEASARASASASASRAAADAAAAQALEQARLEREAAAAAKAKADSDKAAADALAAQIRDGKLADAARDAAVAAATARDAAVAAATAKRLANEELTRKVGEERDAQAAIVAAREALANAQASIAREIEEAKAESLKLKAEAEAKKRAADAAAAAFAAERIALDRAIAEKEALRIAKQAQATASAGLTTNARQAYLDAGGTFSSLRMSDVQNLTQSLTIKKEVLLTQTYPQSNLKIQNNNLPVFVTADELAALLKAYNDAKDVSDADSRALAAAQEEKRLADVALAERKAISDAADAAWKESARLKNLEDQKALDAAARRTALENAIRVRVADALAAAAAAAAAQADLDRKTAADTVASTAAVSMASAAATLESITSDSSNSASLASQALAAFQNVAAASNNAANAAAVAAVAAERESAVAAAAIRARQEADAAAELAARSQSGYSAPSANVSSAETRAAQEAANRARELERQAQEAARLAAEAKAAEEKAAAEKKAAEDAASAAKAEADKAAADAMAKEEAKRNAARNQIARDKATAKKLIEKIKNSAINTSKTITKSSQSINSAYEQALTEAAKSNKALAKLKEQEKFALANLNLAKNQLLALSKVVDKAALEQKQAIAEYGNAQYKVIQLEINITVTENQLVNIEKDIKSSERFYNELQSKFKSLNKAAQTAVAKAAASKKAADSAYQALMAASNSSSLVAGDLQNYLETNAEDWIPTSNATSALSKLQEQYQNAQSQAKRDKASADRALKELQSAREATLKAKQNLDEKIEQRNKLKIDLTSLNSSLKTAKDDLAAATSTKVNAVSAYTKTANNLAQKTNMFRENEINYQSAKSETKYEFENANSRNNQVVALKKLSEWSKNSITTAKEIMNSIDEEVKNLESSQALELIGSDIKVGFISTSIPIIIFTIAAFISLYAILQKRRRKSKIVEIDPNLLEVLRKRAVLEASQAKTNKTKAKKKSR